MIGKMCCNTCVSLDQERKEIEPGNVERYYYGCRIQGVTRKAIAADEELEHQSCEHWEAADEQKLENRGMAVELGKELQNLHDRWKQIYECGGTDLNCPDGLELNLLRNRMVSQKHQIKLCLLEQDYPASYEQELPALVGNQYMARKEEIVAAAKEALQRYKENPDYQWLIQKEPELSERERKQSGIYYALGYVEQLEKAMEQEDCVRMRTHEASEHYIELLRICHDKVYRIMEERQVVNNLPVKKNADKNTEEQPQILGQIDIFSFLAS